MSIPPVDDTELFKNSIKYLYNLSTLSALNVPALESVLTTKRRIMEGRKSTFLPSTVSKLNEKCRRCWLIFSDGPAKYKIKPRMKNHKFAKKISAKLKSNGSSLTKYQRRYLKNMNNFNGNKLVTICKFCLHERIIKMSLPKTLKKTETPVIQTKKKKNKRDRFSGLNQEAVLLSTPQNERNDNSEMPTKKKNKKNVMLHGSNQGTALFPTPQFEGILNNLKIPQKKKKNKNDNDFTDLNQEPIFLSTPQNDRTLNNSEVNFGKLDNTKNKMKINKNKKRSLEEIIVIEEDPKENLNRKKQKKKNLNKLNEFLNNSTKKKKSASASLKHFLKNL